MESSSGSDSDPILAEILARCRDQFADIGYVAVERACTQHPDLEDAIREGCRFLSILSGPGRPRHATAGKSLANYEILREIGAGGMGQVYLAWEPAMGRHVALKKLPAELGSSPKMAERFRREGNALARLEHPNIVPVFTQGITDSDEVFLVMRFVEGESLGTILERLQGRALDNCDASDLSPASSSLASEREWKVKANAYIQACASVAMDISDALQHAHERGLVHRDVKPTNVIIEPCGKPILVDFGLALDLERAEYSRLTDGASNPGTLRYMSPEQAQDLTVDARSDVYSLGATLYHAVTGDPPFSADSAYELREQIISGTLESPRSGRSYVPVDLSTIIRTAMARDPDRRYRTAGALRYDLSRFLDGLPIEAREVSTLAKVLSHVRHHPVAWAVAVIGVSSSVGVPMGFVQQAHAAELRVQTTKQETLRRVAARDAKNLGVGAAKRGDFSGALDHYHAAENLGYEDAVEIQILRIEAFEGLHDLDRAKAQLATLAARPHLGQHRAKLLLLQAYLESNRMIDPDQGLDLVRDAIELSSLHAAGEGGLRKADELTARSLLAPTAKDALVLLRDARRLEPFHRRANDLYGAFLLMSGRLEEASEFATSLRALYPQDPNSMALEALMLALRHEVTDLESLQERIGLRLTGKQARIYTAIVLGGKSFGELDNLACSSLLEENNAFNTRLFLAALPMIAAVSNMSAANRVLHVHSSPLAMRNLKRLFRVVTQSIRGFPSDTIDVLEDCERQLGDGVFAFLAGFVHATRSEFTAGSASFRRARTLPSIVLSRKTIGLYLVRSILLEVNATPSKKKKDDLRLDLHMAIARMVDEETLPPAFVRNLRQAAEMAGLLELATELTARDYRNHPADAKAIESFRKIPGWIRGK